MSTTRDDWMRRLGPLYGGALALVHSTPWRWPDSLSATSSTSDTRSPFWVVAVGVPIGLVAWLAAAALRWIGLPLPIASLVGLAVLTFASAALVERGVVEHVDRRIGGSASGSGTLDSLIGLGGLGTRARTGDSATPSVLALLVLVFATLVRAVAIVLLPPHTWLGVFVATAVVGRWAAVFLQGLGDPIADDDAPRSLVVTPPPAWLTAALSLGVAVVVGLALGKAGILALVLAAAAAFAIGVDAQRRDQGLSSPVVATAAAIAELVLLLAATIR